MVKSKKILFLTLTLCCLLLYIPHAFASEPTSADKEMFKQEMENMLLDPYPYYQTSFKSAILAEKRRGNTDYSLYKGQIYFNLSDNFCRCYDFSGNYGYASVSLMLIFDNKEERNAFTREIKDIPLAYGRKAYKSERKNLYSYIEYQVNGYSYALTRSNCGEPKKPYVGFKLYFR